MKISYLPGFAPPERATTKFPFKATIKPWLRPEHTVTVWPDRIERDP